jgi:hypothetical protein
VNTTTIRQRVDRRYAILALLLAGLFATGLSSLALLTDTLTVNNSFSVSTLDLQASTDGTTFTQSVSNTYALEAGGSTPSSKLVMKNTGNTQLRYALRTVTTGTLKPNLQATIVVDVSGDCMGADQTVVFNGTSGAEPVFGDPAQGTQAGDRVLAAGATETLCLSFGATAAASGTATQVMTYSAEATPNNP